MGSFHPLLRGSRIRVASELWPKSQDALYLALARLPSRPLLASAAQKKYAEYNVPICPCNLLNDPGTSYHLSLLHDICYFLGAPLTH